MGAATAHLVGRLTRDPEEKMTPGGVEISTFSLACDRSGDKQDDGTYAAGFFDVVCWDKTAEIANQYLAKGKQVYVKCRIVHHRWENKDGDKRSKVEFHVEPYGLTLLGSKSDGESRSSDDRFVPRGDQPGSEVGDNDFVPADDFGGGDPPDDIPF